MTLKNKVVLITGGAQGIGHELSKLLSSAGGKVFVFDKMPPGEPIAGVKYFSVNVTSEKEINEALKKMNQKIDVLVNNAGVMRRGSLFESSEADYDFLMDINLKGMWLVTKCAGPQLVKNAAVLFMSSRHGIKVKADPAIYSLSKHGVWGLAEILKKTRPGYKVKVAFPGSVDTALTWVGVKAGDVDAKRKTVVSPGYIVAKLFALIKGDFKKLMFSQSTGRYTLS